MTADLKTSQTQRRCPTCGVALPAGLPPEACPKCLLASGLASQTVAVAGQVKSRAAGLPQPGEQFGPYHILQYLGQGGMGVVYEADDQENGRRIALKILLGALDSVEARTRFLREGQLAASINHPNSVYVFGAGEVAGIPVIAMELMSGGTLRDRVERDGPMPPAAAVDAILQVITGLEAAAQAGLLHRDVKPSNCFIDSDGTIKIGDFGLSIDTTVRTELDSLGHGALFGTPAFCSPEQLRGDRLTLQSDIYALGVTLYYLLTGRLPFERSNLAELIAAVLENRAAPIPQLSSGLNRVLLRCLEKQATARFADYAALRSALLPFASSETAPATLGTRFLAGCMDVVSVACVAFVLSNFKDGHTWKSSAAFYSMVVAYFGLLEGLTGRTLGKAAMGLRIEPSKPTRAFLRAVIFVAIVFGGTDLVGIWADDNGPISSILSPLATLACMGIAFCTARQRNGYAAIHDWLSKTRVVAKPAFRHRLKLAQARESSPNIEAASRIGPYHLISLLGENSEATFWLAYDSRLLRKVWIRQLPPGAPEVSAAFRNISRPTRLRWLNGHRSTAEAWDAYEAAPGRPFLSVIAQPQDWARVRFWLFDLTQELPATFSFDQIWITDGGYAKLLDFPAPGLASSPVASLHQVAVSALEGRTDAAELTAAIPLSARIYLESLKTTVPDPAELALLLQKPAIVTRARRLGMLAASLWFPFFLTVAILAIYPNRDVGMLRLRLGPLLLLWTYGLGLVIVPGLLAALIFRGGAVMRGFGVALVDNHGKPAARWRALWRNFIAFLPFIVLPGMARLFGVHVRLEWLMYLLLTLLAALSIGSALRPGRGLADRLAGTRLVPK